LFFTINSNTTIRTNDGAGTTAYTRVGYFPTIGISLVVHFVGSKSYGFCGTCHYAEVAALTALCVHHYGSFYFAHVWRNI
jgi:hypothetical protein